MKPWVTRVLAGGLGLLVLLMIVGAAILNGLNRREGWDLAFLIAIATAAMVGSLIASRQPGNAVGWFILLFAICFSLGEFSRQYAIYGLQTQPGSLPLAYIMASPPYWVWMPGIILLLVLVPLYFPNGSLLSPRWRVVVWLAGGAALVFTALAAVSPNDNETPGIPNPLGLAVLGTYERFNNLFNVLVPLTWICLGSAATVSLILRYRRASRPERQQLKWFVYAIVVQTIYFAVAQLILKGNIPTFVDSLLLLAAFEFLWIALAISILRYRLYDIDLIVRRTVVYSILTGALALVYFGLVVGLQNLFLGITGEAQSQLVTVLSTLAIAALFFPVRTRVQDFIDRRFYRQKYDAAQTLAEFAATARDEVELETLAERLIQVVDDTMQPETIELKLRTINNPDVAGRMRRR